MKEKDDLKEKLTMFEESSKNLTKLINSQMSANDKTGLGYDSQLSKNEMPKCEILETASDSSNFSNPKRNFVPTVVATKSGQVLVNAAKQNSPASTSTARPKFNTAAIKPSMNVKSSYFKPHFPKRRHLNQRSAAKTNTFSKKINTAKGKIVTTAGPKAVVNAAEGKKETAVKTSADYQEINGGFVAFGSSPKGGKITVKGKIRIRKLDFEDVYFVKELKFNLFSVSQMCDKKNSVLFTETECLVLSLDFKLLDESQMKGIKREFSVARTPQQNGVAERKNRTLIDAARTMLADSLLPTTFWAEAVNTACYVQNRVLVTKPHNKTPYELLIGKFDGKADEGFLVRYSVNSKAFRVFNSRTRKVKENLHVNFLENKPNVAGSGPKWLFNIDSLTKSMNYEPVSAGNQSNGVAGIQTDIHAGQASQEKASVHEYIMLPLISSNPPLSSIIQSLDVNVGDQPGDVNAGDQPRDVIAGDIQGDVDDLSRNDNVCQGNKIRIDRSTHAVNAANTSINTASNIIVAGSLNINTADPNHTDMPTLEATGIFDGAFNDRDLGVEADTNNLDSSIVVSSISITRVHKDHPKEHITGDPNLNTQTRRMINFSEKTTMVSFINRQKRTNHKKFQNCLFACFLSQMEPKKVIQDLKDPIWIEAIQEELLQFKLQDVWTLVDLPYRKRVIGLKWVFRNKLDERGIVIRNKARLVAQGHTQEEGINYDEVFAPVVRKEAIRQFLAYASFKDFIVYQMDVKSVFLYGKIEKEVYVCQPHGFEDPNFPDNVYKVKKALYEKFQMSSMDELTFFLGLQVKQKQDGIFISQDKYVAEILKKFEFSEVKTTSTLMKILKPVLKDEDRQEVDVHIYRSMIGSLMYHTSSRPDIMFVVCACARHQVSPKLSHLHAVKRIFRYLKGQPKLGIWHLKDSPFELKAYIDSDYARSNLDKKSTTGGCQFLSCRLISWQCKKQIVVANSTTEVEYVVASSCCGKVF
nr:putative ribonuclease H-like domain-containing protein [Tanacetum cinerariifolium]